MIEIMPENVSLTTTVRSTNQDWNIHRSTERKSPRTKLIQGVCSHGRRCAVLLEDYKNRTPKSAMLWKRALRVFAGGVNHNIRRFGTTAVGAYPPYITKASGSRILDIDGNEYVDWWMTHYSDILGHGHPAVRESIRQQIDNCIHAGAPGEHQIELAERIQRAIPYMERLRLCTTGSEATMYVTRLARLFTGRPLVAKAVGGWHGGNDSVGFHVTYPFNDEPIYNGVSFDFNDRDGLDQVLREHGERIAAVLVEPMLGAGGGIPPENDFLKYLREETERRGILLIFDEIVTGFRLRYGAAGEEIFGARPDLLTLGKVVGGGMPIGVYGGREDIMRLAAPGATGGRWVGGGTFSGHPLSMVAGIAVLDELKSRSPDYARLNNRGNNFRNSLNRLFEERDAPVLATGYGSFIVLTVLRERIRATPLTGRRLAECADHQRQDILQALLMEQGVFGYHGLGAMSFAHTDDDLKKTLDSVSAILDILRES